MRTRLSEQERQVLLKLPALEAGLQLAVTRAGAPRLHSGPPDVHLQAWPDGQACDRVADGPSQPCSLADLLEVAARLLANRNFVPTVEQATARQALRWSGVEHIDARELDACRAPGLLRPD